jgi:photosystem II stability/assembly factor-like uncharacterized protein
MSPDSPDIIIAAGQIRNTATSPSYLGIHLSKDGGSHWQKIKISNSGEFVGCVAAILPGSAKTLIVGAKASDKGKIYKSLDEGLTWSEITGSMKGAPTCIAIDPNNAQTMYFGTARGLWRSSSGGQAWEKVGGFSNVAGLAYNPADSKEIYLGNSLGVFYSKDRGASWKNISNGMIIKNTLKIVINPSGKKVFAGTEGCGIWKREN